jgi:tetratricopeptide (TPR) repeat protein
MDAETPESGYEGLIPFSAQSPDGYFLGWTPGQRAQAVDTELAWGIQPGNDLIVMLHMKPGAQTERVDASVALYFSDRPPAREPVMIRLNRQDLDIRPGDAAYAATDSYTLPVDVDLYAVQPHAHYLATKVRVQAEVTGEGRRTLLDIDSWDFHWQDVYRYSSPVRLPAGARLSMAFEFDNSAANRSNPANPPVHVIWGQRSSDEMADVWLQVVPRRPEDRPRLVGDLRRQLVPKHIDGYLKMLEVDPLNTALHDDLALLAMEAGNTALAATHFREVLRLRPNAAPAHYNVGNLLLMSGRPADAVLQFRQALGLDPTHGLAQQGLGLAFARLGRMDDAAAALEQAARLLPDSADVAYNLGVVHQQRGRDDAALAAYERVMRLAPAHAEARYGAALIHEARGDYRTAIRLLRESNQSKTSLDAMTALAWLLATAPSADDRDGPGAVVYAEGARSLAPRSPRVLDVLAAALASVRQFDAAVQRAREALDSLVPTADPAFAAAVRARLRLYESHQPFVLPR